MQQLSGIAPHAVTPSPVPTTGPGADVTTTTPNHRTTSPAQAVVTMTVTRNEVVIRADLAMGRSSTALARWQRRRGAGGGWVLVEGPAVWELKARDISPELADLLDRLPFPFAVANMLPRAATPAALQAIAAAEREVG